LENRRYINSISLLLLLLLLLDLVLVVVVVFYYYIMMTPSYERLSDTRTCRQTQIVNMAVRGAH